MNITPGYYKTRDGRKARVLCVDAHGDYPCVGYIQFGNSTDLCAWDNEGDYHNKACAAGEDLIEPWTDEPKPKKKITPREFWIDTDPRDTIRVFEKPPSPERSTDSMNVVHVREVLPNTITLPKDVVWSLVDLAKEASWHRDAWTDEHGIRHKDPSTISIKANTVLESYEAALKEAGE